MAMTRVVEKPHPTLRAQAEAIFLTDRLKRECQHYRVSDHRFEIDSVVLHLVVESFVCRIREKLLQVDFKLLFHLDEAPNALANRRHIDVNAHEDAVVQRLQPGI